MYFAYEALAGEVSDGSDAIIKALQDIEEGWVMSNYPRIFF